MDEILFHISQRLEALQVFIYSSFQNSRISLESYSQHINTLSIRSREVLRSCGRQLNTVALSSRNTVGSYANTAWNRISPLVIEAQEKLLLFIQWLRELCNEAWSFLRQQTLFAQTVRAQESTVTRDTRLELQIGAIGFTIGCAAGLLFGMGWQQRSLPPAVCMKAVTTSNYSGIDAVGLVDEVGAPIILSPDELLIEVVASSVDSTDIAICTGYARTLRRHLGNERMPLVLGRDCSGVVIETGRGVTWLARGDPVWLALPPWRSGGMAQLVVAKESQVSMKPSSLGFEAAASLPYAGLTAWRAAVKQAGLGPDSAAGKRVLVRDAGSAVGCVLVQLARGWGAQVTAVVQPRAREVARQLGAHDVLVASVDLEMELRTRPRYDVVFNTVGPGLNVACRRVCTPEGMVICTTPPVLPADSYGLLLSCMHTSWVHAKCLIKGRTFLTSSWGSVGQGREVLEQLRKLVEQGRLQPVLDRVFSAADAELAFQHAASTNAVGKTVIHFRSLDQGRCNYGA